MIKFFRHIRKSLLMENKTRKYFKYAIGEIGLVVIGILIALSINNWNENVKNKERKKEMLKEIYHEFVTNKEKLQSIVIQHEECYVSAQKVLNMFPIDTNTVNIDTLMQKVFGSFGNWTYEPLQTRIKFFVSSSDFNLIEEKQLQEALISWESVFEDYHEDEQQAIDYNNNVLYPFVRKNISIRLGFHDPRFEKALLQSIEFENIIIGRFRNLNDILYNDTNELIVLKSTIQKIIDLTEPNAKHQ